MFANRVMPSSRPEYQQTVEWLCLPENDNDPLAFLARTGGAKVTDKFEIFCYPELDKKGDYKLHFFAHGLRHLPECSIDKIGQLNQGDKIHLALDFQNPFEQNALQLHTPDNHIVGYCPSYLLDDVNEYVRRGKDFEICVERINDKSAPLQFRLLCCLIVPKMKDYRLFSNKNYLPIVMEIGKTVDDSGVILA